ncbi:MAG: hypothetical protein IPL22_08995 [Bacteroidetes bacterium]|nr:hypothetical protein [Bacteroidota bacterium]
MNRVLVCCLFLAVSFTSCDPLRYFEENKEIPKMEWDKDEPLSFLVSVEDTSLGYNVFINVRNAGFYRFSNLYLFINTTFPRDRFIATLLNAFWHRLKEDGWEKA